MKYISVISVFLLLLITSCDSFDSETIIGKNQLGQLTPSSKLSEIGSILEKDSVAEFDLKSKMKRVSEIEVYNKDGEISLIIEPNYLKDSIATINEIQILDSRYKTKKGLNIDSNFKTIYENYKIDNIQNSINSVILSIDELGAYIVIDKKHLPSELKFDSDIKIEANQIPDDAPLKYFWLRFEDPNL